MKTLSRLALLACLSLPLHAAQPWREITMPTVAEAAAAFPKPPSEYGAIHWAIWGGQLSKERIIADIEHIYANGGSVYMINNSGGHVPKYFTPEYMDLVKTVVQECKKRGMKVWIETDDGYPDGFAGGMISRDYPQLGMQGIVADARYTVAAGQTLKIPLPPDTLGILVNPRAGMRLGGAAAPARPTAVLPLPTDGQFKWTAPGTGMWEITFVRHVYRSSPTRFADRADGTRDKDSLYSLIDYLDPAATVTFIKLIHETYEKLVGDEFGKTILGFRGDEPDYTGFIPWTPKLLETFQKEKGYDLKPYLAQFFANELTPEAQRARADYWDVWSGMFRDNFYKPQQDWCNARHMEYMVHLNHEELMIDPARGEDLIRNEGSFWRDLRFIGVPGIDNLSQIGPGIVADFPKLAASAAHLNGHPQVWEEEGGGPGQSGKFVFDYQLVRGVNYMNIRGLNEAPPAGGEAVSNSGAAIGWYVSRAQHLMAIGRPAAQIALYHPTDSMWMGDKESDDVTVKLVTQLMEQQIDFDHIDADALATVCTLDGGGLKNLSGQIYRAVIVPTSTVIQKNVLERLRAFAKAGGKVIFVGRTPTMVVGKTFLNPEAGTPDLSFATLEPTPDITAKVVAALPKPDVKLDSACAPIKYMHRSLKDGEVYCFFNESNQTQTRTATLAGTGQVQVWDATRGTIHPLAGVAKAAGSVAVPLTLGPQEARFIVIGPLPAKVGEPMPVVSTSQTVAELDSDWSVTLGEKQVTTSLKTWEDLGVASFTGTGIYKREFTPASMPQGKRVYLDLGNVHEIARVRLNGTELEARPWPPYLWDVTASVKSGVNTLEVQVQMASAGERRGGGGGGAGGRRGGATTPSPEAGAPRGAPTDAPGGVAADAGGARRGRGGAGGAGGAPMGGGRGGPAPVAASGMLGPVRLLAQ